MVVVYSSRISGSETSLPMLMEHIFSFQHEIYWKRHDLKNALKKEIFSTKIFDTLCRFVHDDLMVGHPSAQSFQNTPSLEYKVLEQLPTWPILCHQYIKGR